MASNRDSKGRWLPGTSGNPHGFRNRSQFLKLLDEVFPDDYISFMMFAKMSGIKTDVSINKDILKFVNNPELKKRFRRYLNIIKDKLEQAKKPDGKLSDRDKVEMLKWIYEQKYGKAKQHNIEEIKTKEPLQININFVGNTDES